jgi:signal transduction histidine kinase
MIKAARTMRGNARRGEEEVHMTIDDEGVGKDNDTTDDDDRRNNTTIKRFMGGGGGW